MTPIIVLAIGINIVILISVVELIRRNRLKEKYSLLWLFATVVMLWFSISRKSLFALSAAIGIKYPPSLIFLFGLLFLIIINIHLTSVISRLTEQNKNLSQEIAILNERLERIEEKNEAF